LPESPKSLANKELIESDTKDLVEYLAEIVRVWADLPEHIKAAMKALVETHKAETK